MGTTKIEKKLIEEMVKEEVEEVIVKEVNV